ncbi:exodeoxyribonuclease III [Insolitispirillum peregrinum]|uniref:exodeoxyribonuclease III n=1 Tax=Insolitispirillum peregrinum TaxID=80876 RepID=UPI003A93C246
MSSAALPSVLRIASWNVNSVRLRLPHLERLIRAQDPDVICLQETKVIDALFPAGVLADWGYPHQALSGMKSYNGVAILSRWPLEDVQRVSWCGRDDCRHISARVAFAGSPQGSVEVHCLYVPAGGDIPDPEVNPKFAHKLAFLHEVEQWFLARRGYHDAMVLTGDFNVAPLPTDVWDHKKMSRVITHTPVEILHLQRLQDSVRWIDSARTFVPPSEPLFTWWSYRQQGDAWQTSNRGRRLDHLWITEPLAAAQADFEVVRDARGWEPPSDHAPVVLTLRTP